MAPYLHRLLCGAATKIQANRKNTDRHTEMFETMMDELISIVLCRQPFVTLSLDAIATYLVELESLPTSDRQVQQTLADFKTLQRSLQRGL